MAISLPLMTMMEFQVGLICYFMLYLRWWPIIYIFSRLYGERFEEIHEAILLSPIVVIPVILDRLNERLLEWKSAKNHFNRIWRQNTSKYCNKAASIVNYSNCEKVGWCCLDGSKDNLTICILFYFFETQT